LRPGTIAVPAAAMLVVDPRLGYGHAKSEN
jgi:hypothetical protein